MVALLGLAAVAVTAAFVVAGPDDPSPAAQEPASELPADRTAGLQTGTPPWFAEQNSLRARLEANDIPFSEMEGTAVHIHPRLEVYANGAKVVVPTDIGISYAEQAMAALHTHDEAGTIHVESPVVRDYTLGQFFDTWGVRLTKRCIGGYCVGNGKQLRAFVDRKAVADPRAVTLKDDQRIIVVFGTPAQIRQATT